ncbi:MAG: hypothetical protein PHE58_08060, partial [Candidatus Omnitrophica bacterium]|nr:hypothetical protein [Candidatus Omnitrophota bacterium]
TAELAKRLIRTMGLDSSSGLQVRISEAFKLFSLLKQDARHGKQNTAMMEAAGKEMAPLKDTVIHNLKLCKDKEDGGISSVSQGEYSQWLVQAVKQAAEVYFSAGRKLGERMIFNRGVSAGIPGQPIAEISGNLRSARPQEFILNSINALELAGFSEEENKKRCAEEVLRVFREVAMKYGCTVKEAEEWEFNVKTMLSGKIGLFDRPKRKYRRASKRLENRLPNTWKTNAKVRSNVSKWLIGLTLMEKGKLPERSDFYENGMSRLYKWIVRQRRVNLFGESGIPAARQFEIISLIKKGDRKMLFDIGRKIQEEAISSGLKGFGIADIGFEEVLHETARIRDGPDSREIDWETASFDEKVNILSKQLIHNFTQQNFLPPGNELPSHYAGFIQEWFDDSLYKFLSYAGFFDRSCSFYHANAVYEPWTFFERLPASFWECRINRVAAYVWMVEAGGLEALSRMEKMPFGEEQYGDPRIQNMYNFYYSAGKSATGGNEKESAWRRFKDDMAEETGLDLNMLENKLRTGQAGGVFITIQQTRVALRKKLEAEAVRQRYEIRQLVRVLRGYKVQRREYRNPKADGVRKPIIQRSHSEIPQWLKADSKEEEQAARSSADNWQKSTFDEKIMILTGVVIKTFKETGKYPTVQSFEPHQLNFIARWFGSSLYKFLLYAGFLTSDSCAYDPALKSKPWIDLNLPKGFWKNRSNRVIAYFWMVTLDNGECLKEEKGFPFNPAYFNRHLLSSLYRWYQDNLCMRKNEIMLFAGDDPEIGKVISTLFINPGDDLLSPVSDFASRLAGISLSDHARDVLRMLYARSLFERIKQDIIEETGLDMSVLEGLLGQGMEGEVLGVIRKALIVLHEKISMELEHERALIVQSVEYK